jgi:transcriptional regulator with XRE-family HTH domain
MHYFKENMDAAFKALTKKYPTLSKHRFANLIGISRTTLYRYWEGSESMDNFRKNTLDLICFNLKDQLNVEIEDSQLLVIRDLRKVLLEGGRVEAESVKKEGEKYQRDVIGLGNYLRDIRLKQKLSYRDIAKMSWALYPHEKDKQISDVHVLKIERGDFKSPSIMKLATIAKVLKIPMEKILEFSGGVEVPIKFDGKSILINVRQEYLDIHKTNVKEVEKKLRNIIETVFPGMV